MMNTKDLAVEFYSIVEGIRGMPSNGERLADGWTALYNDSTGQSRIVGFHADSGLVFKTTSEWNLSPTTLSAKRFGTVRLSDGNDYMVRLPVYKMETVADRDGTERCIEVQEFIGGETCFCGECSSPIGWHCENRPEIERATGCNDAHAGNWKIFNGEVVLFDFEGLPDE